MTPPHKPLPPGLYSHGDRYRARCWIDDDGQRHARKRPGRRAGWITWPGPRSEAVERFRAWREGREQPRGEVAAAIAAYRESSAGFLRLAPSTRRTEGPRLDRLARVFGHLKIAAITADHLRQYLEAQPDAPHGAAKDLRRLSALFTQWQAAGLVDRNPCAPVLKVFAARDQARDRYVTDEEYDATLAALRPLLPRQHSARVVYGLVQLALLTGRRRSDLLRLQWSAVSEAGIVFGEGKTGKRVMVGATPALLAVLAEIRTMLPGSLFVLPNRDGRQTSEHALNQAWLRLRPVLAEAGVESYQIRDLRAKHATDFDGDATENLGHSSRAVTTRHYKRKPATVRSLK